MLLNFKTVKGRKFSLEVEQGEEFAQIKQRVADVIEGDAAGVRLIHKGKMLNSGGINERFNAGDTVIVMSKPTAKPKPKPKPAEQPAVATESAAAVQPSPAQPAQPAQPVQQQAVQPAQPAQPAQAAPRPAQNEEAVQQLMMLGDFTRSQVERALEMAGNSADMAANLLFSGSVPRMPAPRPQQQAQQQQPQQQQPQQQGQPAQAQQGAMPAAAAQEFEGVRQLLQSNPQLVAALLSQLAANDPQMAAMLQQNPAAVMQLVQQPAMLEALVHAFMRARGGGGMGAPPQDDPNVIRLTPEEAEAVQRLALLGFPEQLALQAYLLCDKDENAAASYLFENQESLMADWNENPEQGNGNGNADQQ